MPHDEKGRWLPDLAPKGFEVFNDYHRYLLVDGPRKCGKTIAICNKLCRHAFETRGGIIAIITKTLKNAKSSGVWQDLYAFVVPDWVKSNIGFKVTKEVTMAPDTKMTYFRVRNAFGGETEFQLHSLEHTSEAESKFKGTRFSLVFISEADQFGDRAVFDILTDQLRVVGVPFEGHQIILDTNPPEEGEEHWLHDVFFKDLGGRKAADPSYASLFGRIGFAIHDNPYLDPRERDELINKYAHDKHKYARFIEGRWVRDDTKGLFVEVFRNATHIAGDASSPREDDWELLVPPRNCMELYTGWDLGDVNHAMSIACKREDGEDNTAFDIIDELVAVDKRISIRDFTEAAVERVLYWEDYLKKEYGVPRVLWRHWSDNSAWRYRSAADSYDEMVVRQASEGRIVLNAVTKGGGSVKLRIGLLKKLLFENRIFFSAHLSNTIRMLRELKAGTNKAEPVRAGDRNKHIFDAMTYMLLSETPIDMQQRTSAPVIKRPNSVITI
jgi:hypothetical protein